MNHFYVYILLDPRSNVLRPFYIGKGQGDRQFSSMRIGRNILKNSIIGKIRESGAKIGVHIHAADLSEVEAFSQEKSLIKRFGRRDNGTGILANLTDGGEGVSGYVFGERRRKEYSKKFSGELNPMYGKIHSAASIEKIRITRHERTQAGLIKPTMHSDEHKNKLRSRAHPAGFGYAKRRVLKICPINGIVETYDSTMIFASALGLASHSNTSAMAGAGCLPRADGFFYRYEDAKDVVDGRIVDSDLLLQKVSFRSNTGKAVGEFKDGLLSRSFHSVREASAVAGLKYHILWKAVKTEKSIDGVIWRYI